MTEPTLPTADEMRAVAPDENMKANRENPTERNAQGWCFDDLETYRSYSKNDPLGASILCQAVAAESALIAMREELDRLRRGHADGCPLAGALRDRIADLEKQLAASRECLSACQTDLQNAVTQACEEVRTLSSQLAAANAERNLALLWVDAAERIGKAAGYAKADVECSPEHFANQVVALITAANAEIERLRTRPDLKPHSDDVWSISEATPEV